MQKKLAKYKYPEVSSVSKPVPGASNDPLPICPGTSASSMGICSPSSTSIGSDFKMEEKHLVSQSELNDLVRDLNLSKQKSELLASRMQEWTFLDSQTKVTVYRTRNEALLPFFEKEENICFCNDINGLFDAMNIPYDVNEWRLFIDGLKYSLKAALIHNGNIKPSIPIAHAVQTKECYDTISKILTKIKYKEHQWKICGDLKDCFYTSRIVTSSTSTSVMSTDTSSSESESESDDSFSENENNTHIKDGKFTVEELKLVYAMVVQNIEECATRFPEHYKSIYRLIYHYMNSQAGYSDLALSEQLLLGQYKTSLGNIINGLFSDRKNNNLFNGIWRIPSSEIDRPGSFSAHLVKCVKIFIQWLFETKNHTILVDLAMNLYKTPDLDKRYITDIDRSDLCQQSINYSIQILRSVLQINVDKHNDTEILNLLVDIYKIHKKCVKYMNQKEPMFAELLIDAYKCFIKDKVEYVPVNCNLLDLAIKLCVQEITAQKNMEKSLHSESTVNTSFCIGTQSPEISNMTPSRVVHIPGFNMRPKFRANTLKPSTASTSSLSAQNTLNLLPTDFIKNPQPETETPEFQKLIEEFYSKVLHNELQICSATTLVPQKPINHVNNPTALHISNTMSSILPHTPVIPSTIESSIYECLHNTDKRHAEISDKILLQNQAISPFSKQHNKPKISNNKNKSIFKPYIRPDRAENCQNISKNTFSNYKVDILSHHVEALAAYSKLLYDATSSQIDLNEQLPETSQHYLANIAIKDLSNDVTSLKSTTTQARFMRNQFSIQQCTNSPSVNSTTKTLQEKLAERQKAYQLNEYSLGSTSTNTNHFSSDDVIVLD